MKLAVALVTVYLVWGSTYLAIAVANRTLPPLLMLSVRFLIAGALLYGWSLWRGDVAAERPGRRQWGAAAVVGGLLLVVDTGGVAWVELRVPSGIAALLVATVPVFIALLDRAIFGIRLGFGAVAGISTGLVGVAILVGPSGKLDALGAAVILVASLAWAAGSVYARVAPLPCRPVLTAAMQMLCAGVLLAVAGLAMGEGSRVHLGAISAASDRKSTRLNSSH
jgi:drug/metabolite transporter (DMT)-like permease